MHIRGKNYTFRSLLMMDDFHLETLNDEEQKIAITYCYSHHMDEFKNCVLELLESHDRFLNNDLLDKYENELLKTSNLLDAELEAINEKITTTTQKLANDIEQLQGIVKQSFTYRNDLNEMLQIRINILKAQKILRDSKIKLKERSNPDNFGLKKIENCISFCINLILNHPFLSALEKNNNQIYPAYSRILTSLAEFYYNHGKNLFIIINEPNEDPANKTSRMPDNHIAISLILFMMSGSSLSSTLENACYVHLLEKVLNANIDDNAWMRDFDLRALAFKSPSAFAQLYDYLFFKNDLFKSYLFTNNNENVYLTYKSGLLTLYMSFALNQMASESADNISKINIESCSNIVFHNRAKRLFLYCLKNGMPNVIDIFYAHFPELDVNIELALYYYKNDDSRSFPESEKVYDKIKSLTLDELTPHTNNLFLLFRYWLNQKPSIEWNKIAIKILLFYVNKGSNSAEQVLMDDARVNIETARLYSDLVIDMKGFGRIKTTSAILNKLEYRNDAHILFNSYQLSVMANSPDYWDLFDAAQLNSKVATDELFRLCQQQNMHGLQHVLHTRLLAHNSLLAFQLLNENSHSLYIEFDLAIFALQHKISTGKNRVDHLYEIIRNDKDNLQVLDPNKLIAFYEYLCQSTDDIEKTSFALAQLRSYLGKNENAYNSLRNLARGDYSIAIDLIKFCLNTDDPGHAKLQQLKNVLELYHKEHLSSEGKYYLYLMEKKISRQININLLNELLKDNYELVVSEFNFLFNQIYLRNQYKFILNNESIDIIKVISYFENELAAYVQNKAPRQYEIAEILSFYYLRQKEFLKAEKYIRICFELNLQEAFNKIFIDSKQDYFSDAFKQFYLEKKKMLNDGNSIHNNNQISRVIKSKIILFSNDKSIAERLENEKFKLKKIISASTIPEEQRFDILDQMQKVRDFDGLSIIKSQLLEYMDEPAAKLRK